MPRYVDGYVIVLPRKNLATYRRIAKIGAKVWKDHGALEYCECVGENLRPKFGTPFPRQLKLKPRETVVFSWVTFKSRAHRDRVNAKVMKDPRLADATGGDPMPFDCSRMLYGGFEVLVYV